MKKIITALGNPLLNNKLLEENNFEILSKDIQYQDGIFEILRKKEEIDYLILSELLPGENELIYLINKIKNVNKKINIIIILENKKEELENILYSKGIKKIYYNNEVEINEIINYLKNEKENENEKLKIEIENLKKILIKNNIILEKNNYENILNQEKKEKNNIKLVKKELNKKQIISVAGISGVGKSIITINLANILKNNNKKVLIIDFDILNNSLHTILGVNKYSQKIKNKLENNNLINNKIDIKDLIIKINRKVDLISGINLIFENEYKISCEKIKLILEELKINYDYIIIDTSSECFFDYTKNILNYSNKIIFLIESNLLEINKSKKYLELYENNWDIKKEKINILINKYNKNSIDEKIIKNIFQGYKILGKIKLNKKYNILINKNYKTPITKKCINKEYKKISNKIIKLNNNNLNLFLENVYNKFKYDLCKK
ncbi:MAG: AAA family ATPase [Clostridia bacterium]|nr:AAA family ATPase [Clostridia bacterium]